MIVKIEADENFLTFTPLPWCALNTLVMLNLTIVKASKGQRFPALRLWPFVQIVKSKKYSRYFYFISGNQFNNNNNNHLLHQLKGEYINTEQDILDMCRTHQTRDLTCETNNHLK